MNEVRIQKLEALLNRIQRNRSARSGRPATTTPTAVAEPMALEAFPVPPAPAPFVSPSARPPAPEATKPVTPVSPPVVAASVAAPTQAEAPAAPTAPPPAEPTAPPPAAPTAPPPVATPSWSPEPGSAVQARPTTVPPMELSEDDLVDVTTLPPAPDADGGEVEIVVSASSDAETEEELPPSSSRRSKEPATIDEAIANASPVESDREIPAQTPPPESGPQEALPATGLEAPRLPDVDSLEADLSGPPSMGPTAEQLGETIELEAPRGPELEIDVAVSEAEPAIPAPAEELEVTLPRPSLESGLYDVSIAAPPSVEMPAPEVHVAVTVPAVASGAEGPERVARPALGATDVAEVRLVSPGAPKSFLELLDASLGL